MLSLIAAAYVCLLPVTQGDVGQLIHQLSAKDRERQADAVDELAAIGPEVSEQLVSLWNETDRFDVRAHVVQVAERWELEGVPLLMELSRQRTNRDNWDWRSLLVNAFVDLGPDAVPVIIANGMRNSGGISHPYLSSILRALEIDPEPIANQFLASSTVEVRIRALYLMDQRLPIQRRSIFIARAAQDAEERVSRTAAFDLTYPKWSDQDKQEWPDEFKEFTRILVSLLDSPDEIVIRGAASALRNHGCSDPSALPRLRAIFETEEAIDFWSRANSMRAYLAMQSDTESAVRVVLQQLDRSPAQVCIALLDVNPDLIPEDAIPGLVDALPDARGREERWGSDLLKSLDARAVDPLVKALAASDLTLSVYAARVLGRIGAPAKQAVPDLVRLSLGHGESWQRMAFIYAMIAIDLDSIQVQDTLKAIVARASEDDAETYVSGNTLRDLMRDHGELEWVRSMALPIMHDTSHPLNQYSLSHLPKEFVSDFNPDQGRLVADLLNTEQRDARWGFANGRAGDPDNGAAYYKELNRRRLAIKDLLVIEEADGAVIEGLVKAISSEIIEIPEPPIDDIDVTKDRRKTTLGGLWKSERGVSVEVGKALAKELARNPEKIPGVIERLRPYPHAMAILISSPVDVRESPSDWKYLEIPEEATPAALASLLKYATVRTPEGLVSQSTVIHALGRLSTEDPRRLQTLRDLIDFGEGKAGPGAAMASLGLTRPMTPDILDIIRAHIDDPRYSMRSAAIQAAGHAGFEAAPLIDELVQRGRVSIQYSIGSLVAHAVTDIAPEDPRVIEYLRDYREQNRMRHPQN